MDSRRRTWTSGLSLASRVRKVFNQIPDSQLIDMMKNVHNAAIERRLLSSRWRPGLCILPIPLTVLSEQLTFNMSRKRSCKASQALPTSTLPILPPGRSAATPGEEQWLSDCWGPRLTENNPCSAPRCLVDFISPMWKDSLLVEAQFERHPAVCTIAQRPSICAEQLMPSCALKFPTMNLEICPDIRDLLMQKCSTTPRSLAAA